MNRTVAQDIQPTPNTEVIDAKGLYVIPGGVDPDCRLVDPKDGVPVADNYKNGSVASLCGGTTTISKLQREIYSFHQPGLTLQISSQKCDFQERFIA